MIAVVAAQLSWRGFADNTGTCDTSGWCAKSRRAEPDVRWHHHRTPSKHHKTPQGPAGANPGALRAIDAPHARAVCPVVRALGGAADNPSPVPR